ncbi:MAG TPA: Hsp20/alpha crystallin family protein [Polyangiaceae bacterium]|nr:Hsp20/alpha crystallin family protein [Polyangiaceae bacterium]
MSKLERWLPFMFKKKTKQEAQPAAEPSAPTRPVPHQAMVPLAPMFAPQMQQLMRGFFDDPFFREPFGRFGQMDRWFGDFSPGRFSPSVEVSDEGEALKVTAELPGMEKDDVKLQLEGNLLVISGEKKSESENEDEGVFRTERYYGYFQRAVPLPEDVDREKAAADFKKGVLTVRFPKVEGASEPSRRIAIAG